MKDTLESKPAFLPAFAACLAVIAFMAWFRFVVFRDTIIPLTYALGLLLTLWHRDRRLHFGMTAVFIGMSAVKNFVWLPDEAITEFQRWSFWAMQLVNIAVVSAAVDLVNRYRARLESERAALARANSELEAMNEELATREEEIVNQNEELQQQAEELEQQTEELEAQTEEVRAINEELGIREETLQALLDVSTYLAREQDASRRICELAPKLVPSVDACAILARAPEGMKVQAHVGLGEHPKRLIVTSEKSVASLVIERGETGFLEDVNDRPDLEIPEGDSGRPFRSILVSPLRVNGEIAGVFEVYTYEPHRWIAEEIRLSEWLAQQCAKVWETMRLRNERQEAEEALKRLNQDLEQKVVERTAIAEERAERLRALTIELAQAEQRERRNLAKLLHDGLQQNLVAAKLHIGLLRVHDSKPEIGKTAELITDLLSEALQTSRTLTVELSPAVLHEGGLVAGLEWLCRAFKEKHALEVRLDADPDLKVPDEDLRMFVFEAVRELLFNIVKHAGVSVASVRLAAESGRSLLVRVWDKGRGFSAQSQPLLNLSGFGLFGIQQRVESLGGTLVIQSVAEQGCAVEMRIPAEVQTAAPTDWARPELAKSVHQIPAASSRDGQRPGIRILLVDDHEIVREGLSTLIGGESGMYVVGEARDGESAIERVRQLSPDVVVMDVNMPGMDGIEATRRLTAEFPDIAIIGLSMFEEADRAEAMLKAGARLYLCKDGPFHRLIDAIRLQAEPRSQSRSESVSAGIITGESI